MPGRLELCAFFAGLCATLLLGYWGIQHNDHGERLRFEQEAKGAVHAIELRLRGYHEVLRGIGALFDVPRETTREDFRAFVRSLDLKGRYPGVETLSFSRYVRGEERAAFDATRRSRGVLGGFP